MDHLVFTRLLCAAAVIVAAGVVLGQTKPMKGPQGIQIKYQQLDGPQSPADFPAWIVAMRAWRAEQLAKMKVDRSNYANPEFAWAKSSFIQPLMMVEDRFFYDPQARTYTVGRYLADLRKRYDGIDSILIWPTYPNIGIDDRNTDDMFRSMPGGIGGLKQMVADFHREGVKVFFPIHPWDIGTRDAGTHWSAVLPQTMAEIGADGLNGDTMYAVAEDYFDSALAAGHPLVLEPELGLQNGRLNQLGWNLMSWGYWETEGPIPMVSVNKWLEPRHQVNVCDRWSANLTGLIQTAFFNGVGIVTWENIWSIWNGISPRDEEAVRRVAAIERAFPDLLSSQEWEPHTPTLQGKAVFASKWPSADGSETLWTIVNRSDKEAAGEQIVVPFNKGWHYWDVWHGVPLSPQVSGDAATLRFEIEPHGYGCVYAAKTQPANLQALLVKMMAAKPLASFSSAKRVLKQRITPIKPTRRASSAPEGMVYVPPARFDFVVKGIEIEGEDLVGVDVQYPWETEPRRNHQHAMDIEAFYIDKYPVTNAQFKRFLDAVHYRPEDSQNFLKAWKNGTYPEGWAAKPVTWVSLEDARAYAKWAGKRLPHEWEWQYAAGGADGRIYPWGSVWDPTKVPPVCKDRTCTPPADVDASNGAGPFGAMDLVGNVWQYTDEFADDHTRSVILRGGSHYQPQGSMWYFPQAYRLDQHGKYLLMAPCKDRSACVGFRCVVDAQ